MKSKSDWTNCALGEIAPPRSNEMPGGDTCVWNLSLDEVESISGRVLERTMCRVNELGSSKCCFDDRHVLYSKLRPYLNKVVLPDQFGVGTSELIPLLPDNSRLLREYLAYYLRSPAFVAFANANTRGANLPRIAMAELWKHEIPMPACLDEQRRIVGHIEDCMERLGEIEGLSNQAAHERAAIVAAARDESFAMECATVELGSTILEGPTNGLYKHSKFYGSGLPILRIDAFSGGDVVTNPTELKRLELDGSELSRFALSENDIVLNRVNGSLDVVGKSCLIGSLIEPTVFESNMMRFSVDPEKANVRFVLHFLASPNCRDQIKRKAKVIQQASINQKDVRSLVMPLPSLEKQQSIVGYLDEVSRLAVDIRETACGHKTEMASLRASILRKAFAGEL